MSIIITTPTGKIGSQLAKLLLDAGEDITLLARNPEKVQSLVARGAKVVQGSLEDRNFVINATRGASALFWVTPAKLDVDDLRTYQRTLGNIAAEAININKIPYVVNLSSIGAHLCSNTGPIDGLCDIEHILNETNANIVHLRPAQFFENILMQLDNIVEQGKIYLPVTGKITAPMIASRDIAKVAARYLRKRDWTGKNVHELLGAQDLSFADIAKTLSQVLGRKVNLVTITPEQSVKNLTNMGASKDLAQRFTQMFMSVESGYLTGEMPRSRMTTTETTFADFARDVIKKELNH